MAQDDSQEKTEEATPRKLRDARKKGQVPKSKDINTAIILLGAFGVLAITKATIGESLSGYMAHCMEFIANPNIETGSLLTLFGEGIAMMFKLLTPFLLVVFVVAAMVGYLQVGSLLALEPIKPDLKKLNPVQGFKNMFKWKTFLELIKSAIKIFAVGIIAYYTLKESMRSILLTLGVPIEMAASLVGVIAWRIMYKVVIIFLILAVIDMLLQKKIFAKEMKMSKYEVKQEYKREEGDPLIKATRRQLHYEMATTDMQQGVQNSDVVVVNPVEVAVAVKYDYEEMRAPEVMASGERLVADRIKVYAEQYEIPIVRNVPLAHALLRVETGDEIPEDLYKAIAEVLEFVYKLAQDRGEA